MRYSAGQAGKVVYGNAVILITAFDNQAFDIRFRREEAVFGF
ncbi:hypothetical protein Barb6_03182 [Bacteroidales bacterium Barb6]|nr:hypothetical protein Barb6_03182 [Bacteroidales bacterium Barb6]OAV64915.1 hypothetical protein Barb4_03745 [Bacteroidales bacterium Barb4]